eukprot:m.21492 g.21492  ORF g.21492 m.21492 type:complete len:455 (-) comp12439_c0_seq3:106-1470(-)
MWGSHFIAFRSNAQCRVCLPTLGRQNNIRHILGRMPFGDIGNPVVRKCTSMGAGRTLQSIFPTTQQAFKSPVLRIAVRRVAQDSSQHAVRPSKQQLFWHAINGAVPFVGFGFMDNVVMILAGDQIDYHLGSKFGLHTLTAAGFGQVISDVMGVSFGQLIENFAKRLGLPASGMTAAQLQLTHVVGCRTAGSMVGVASGCLLGMLSILLLDMNKKARECNLKQLEPLLKEVVKNSHDMLSAEHCHLWLLDDQGYMTSYGNRSVDPEEPHMKESFRFCADGNGAVTAKQIRVALRRIGRLGTVSPREIEQQLIQIEEKLRGRPARPSEIQLDDNYYRLFSYEVFRSFMQRELNLTGLKLKVRNRGFKAQVISSRKTLVKEYPNGDPSFNRVHNLVTGYRTRNVLISPIISRKTGEVVGLIEMANKKNNGSFGAQDEKTLELICSHSAIFLDQLLGK